MEKVNCILANKTIDFTDCLEISEIANNCIVDEVLDEIPVAESFKNNSDWKDMCRNCKYNN